MEHAWDVSTSEAKRIQEKLRQAVRVEPLRGEPRWIAACDVAFLRAFDALVGGVVVFDLRSRAIVEERLCARKSTFPYVPGLLSFRETPVILEAMKGICSPVDVLIADGHGYAHPRRFGVACHLGVLLDVPTIGCAKKRLIGEEGALGEERGATAPLTHRGEVIGRLLRTRARTKPVYVSVGHRVTLDDAVRVVMSACAKYRLPDPARQAHRKVTQARKELETLLAEKGPAFLDHVEL